MVLSVGSARWDPRLLASSSKDNSCLFWRISTSEDNANLLDVEKIGIATGHTNSVSGIQFCRHRESEFFVTVSNDSTLKLWSLKPLLLKREEGGEKK